MRQWLPPLCAAVLLAALATPPAESRGRDRQTARRSRADSLGHTPVVLVGSQLGDRFGDPVACAGDVNGDGFDDLVVGAWGTDSGGAVNSGRAYLLLGSAAGVNETPAWVRGGTSSGAQFGMSVSSAGDVNGDGYDDVLAGAGREGADQRGHAFLYLGGSAGLDTIPAWQSIGPSSYSWFGTCVAGVGDVNGDGYADFAVGAPNANVPAGNAGDVRVYYGSPAGPQPSPTVVPGELPGSWFGYSVACAGDVNRDGFDDMAVGAVYGSHPEMHEGLAYLFLGSASGIATVPSWVTEADDSNATWGISVRRAGDLDADGYDDLALGAHHFGSAEAQYPEGPGAALVYRGSATGLATTPLWFQKGPKILAHFGHSVGCAGDVNGDGVSDLFVSTMTYTGTVVNEGRVQVFYGHAGTGPSTVADWSYAPGVRVSLGQSVAADMDLNGDGAPDLAAGTSGAGEGSTSEYGQVFVFYGVPSPLSVPTSVRARSSLGAPVPLPFRERVRIPFVLGAAGPARLAVFDLAGRLVATLFAGRRAAGGGEVVWDGRDARGRACAAGVYVVRLEAGGDGASRRVVLVR